MSTREFSKIGIGSGSQIKIRAVQTAFPNSTVIPHTTAASNVKDQPIGKRETYEGARNRAIETFRQLCKKDNNRCDAYIGIENGIWDPTDDGWDEMDFAKFAARMGSKPDHSGEENQHVWIDAAIVVMLVPIDESKEEFLTFFVESEHLPLPPKSKRPFEGGKRGEWSVLKDPHEVLTGGKKPRAVFLVEAMENLKKDIEMKQQQPGKL